MALSATSFPEKGLTYAILYGCTNSLERTLLQSLRAVGDEASHPLLMPAIFAELELLRHTRQVDINIIDVETKIFALDFEAGATEGPGREDSENRHEAKRSSWLAMTYLRNSLITTNVQNEKISKHAVDLGQEFFNPTGYSGLTYICEGSKVICATRKEIDDTLIMGEDHRSLMTGKNRSDVEPAFLQRMRQVGDKIELRMKTIHEEYEEKIRDCTMRVDGMAMATQWVNPSIKAVLTYTDKYSRTAKPLQKWH